MFLGGYAKNGLMVTNPFPIFLPGVESRWYWNACDIELLFLRWLINLIFHVTVFVLLWLCIMIRYWRVGMIDSTIQIEYLDIFINFRIISIWNTQLQNVNCALLHSQTTYQHSNFFSNHYDVLCSSELSFPSLDKAMQRVTQLQWCVRH